MKQKIVGICIMGLFLAIAVFPALGIMNEQMKINTMGIQKPEIEWMKTFDRGEFDHFHTARQTADGGYIACGDTEENDMYYVWMVKLDISGIEEWTAINYDLNGSYLSDAEMLISGFDVQQTSDDGYIVTGVSMIQVDIGDSMVWVPTGYLWKTDQNGNTEWLKHYYEITTNGISYWPYNVIETADGFIIGAMDLHYDLNTYDVIDRNGLIMKTDLSGTLQWVKEFDKGGTDSFSSVACTSDDGYLLTGYTDNKNVNQGALWMMKTDATANKEWDKVFDGPKFEYTFGKGCCQTSDGGYIMSGVSSSYGHGRTDVWVIKTDSDGNLEWDAAFGDKKDDYSWGMCAADSNGFALAISTNHGSSIGNKDDILIIETDEMGNAEWKLQIEEEGTQRTRSIAATDDGGYIVSAMTARFGNSRSDGIIVKLSSFDNERPLKPEIDGPAKGKPGKEYSFSADSSDPDGSSLQYKWDWGDGNYSEWLYNAEVTYTWKNKEKFEVRVMVQDEDGGESRWSDPLIFSTAVNKIYLLYQLWIEMIYNQFPYLQNIVSKLSSP